MLSGLRILYLPGSINPFKMPCVCGAECKVEGSKDGENTGHRCPGCKRPIHAICGVNVPNEKATFRMNHYCFVCYGKRFGDESKTDDTPDNNTELATKKRKATPNAEAPKKKALASPKKKTASSPTKKRQKKFEIDLTSISTEDKKDSFLRAQVAFPVEGKDKPSWLVKEQFPQDVFSEVNGQMFLFGTVINSVSGSTKYTVKWSHTSIKDTKLPHVFIKNGVELAESLSLQIEKQKKSSRLHPDTIQ